MPKASNPLLIALRTAGVTMKCVRIYTSALQDGSFRVKLFIADSRPSLQRVRAALEPAGFVDISVKTTHTSYYRWRSVTIRASKK